MMILNAVNIIMAGPEKKWILGRMAAELIRYAPPGVNVTLSGIPSNDPREVNYYIPYRVFLRPSGSVDVIFCTHPELPWFWESAQKADHAVVMCDRYRRELSDRVGSRVTLIHPGVDDRYHDEKLHIFQPIDMKRGQRKGLDAWKRLCGVEWLDCLCPNGAYTDKEIYNAYRACDVVVSTSTNQGGGEGGPMLVPEGLAMGKTVVAPMGVGLCDEIEGVILYPDGDYEALLGILRGLHEKKLLRQAGVKGWTWQKWAGEHYALFERLINAR